MEERDRRVGLNEALFREVNERLRDVNEAFGAVTQRMELVCECGDAGCAERITMSVAEYEELRSHPDRFVVVHGHADRAEIEEVVAQRPSWDVVRKRPGAPTTLAERTDPRS